MKIIRRALSMLARIHIRELIKEIMKAIIMQRNMRSEVC